MIDGPKLTDRQVFERVTSLFQTYDTTGRSILARTVIVLEQQPPYLTLDGEAYEFLIWCVESDSREGNTWEVRGYESGEAAETAAVEWLGVDRRIPWDKLSPSALTVLMSHVQRIAWR